MIWDEFLRHFRFCDEEDSGLSDEEQERKGPKNRPKHTRKRTHQAKKNFLEKFKTASKKNVKLNDLKENEMMCINGGAGWLGPSIIFQIAMEILDGTFFSDIEKGYNGEW